MVQKGTLGLGCRMCREVVQACQDRGVLTRTLGQLAARSEPMPAAAEAMLNACLPRSEAASGAASVHSDCRDPADLWAQIAAELKADLTALRSSESKDPTAASFAAGLALIARQMEAALPHVGCHGTGSEQERPHREALKALLLTSVLPVVDNLNRGLKAMESHSNSTPLQAALRTLATKTNDQLECLLALWCVSSFDPLGQRFDPNEHEAIAQTEDERIEAGHISIVYQKGFRLGPPCRGSHRWESRPARAGRRSPQAGMSGGRNAGRIACAAAAAAVEVLVAKNSGHVLALVS
jgi:molecular chaperone GrpE (heat shock protein)